MDDGCCPHCSENYRDCIKRLQCGHNMCLSCVVGQIASGSGAGSGYITCAVGTCRRNWLISGWRDLASIPDDVQLQEKLGINVNTLSRADREETLRDRHISSSMKRAGTTDCVYRESVGEEQAGRRSSGLISAMGIGNKRTYASTSFLNRAPTIRANIRRPMPSISESPEEKRPTGHIADVLTSPPTYRFLAQTPVCPRLPRMLAPRGVDGFEKRIRQASSQPRIASGPKPRFSLVADMVLNGVAPTVPPHVRPAGSLNSLQPGSQLLSAPTVFGNITAAGSDGSTPTASLLNVHSSSSSDETSAYFTVPSISSRFDQNGSSRTSPLATPSPTPSASGDSSGFDSLRYADRGSHYSPIAVVPAPYSTAATNQQVLYDYERNLLDSGVQQGGDHRVSPALAEVEGATAALPVGMNTGDYWRNEGEEFAQQQAMSRSDADLVYASSYGQSAGGQSQHLGVAPRNMTSQNSNWSARRSPSLPGSESTATVQREGLARMSTPPGIPVIDRFVSHAVVKCGQYCQVIVRGSHNTIYMERKGNISIQQTDNEIHVEDRLHAACPADPDLVVGRGESITVNTGCTVFVDPHGRVLLEAMHNIVHFCRPSHDEDLVLQSETRLDR